jgi:hypothetical protein
MSNFPLRPRHYKPLPSIDIQGAIRIIKWTVLALGSEAPARSLANLRPWRPGQSGNPKEGPVRHDLASEIARAVFEHNAEALYAAFTKACR